MYRLCVVFYIQVHFIYFNLYGTFQFSVLNWITLPYHNLNGTFSILIFARHFFNPNQKVTFSLLIWKALFNPHWKGTFCNFEQILIKVPRRTFVFLGTREKSSHSKNDIRFTLEGVKVTPYIHMVPKGFDKQVYNEYSISMHIFLRHGLTVNLLIKISMSVGICVWSVQCLA